MKTGLLLTLVFVSTICLQAGAQTLIIDSSEKSLTVDLPLNGAEVNLPAVKKKPEFPGGRKVWQDFLRSKINIRIPFENKARPGVHRVMIRFIVDSKGKLMGVGADSNSGYGMESEVIRCIQTSPDWIPAETSDGQKVAFTLRTVVIFNVRPNDITISFDR